MVINAGNVNNLRWVMTIQERLGPGLGHPEVVGRPAFASHPLPHRLRKRFVRPKLLALGQLYGTEEKILNLTHLVKLSQSYYDRQYEQMGQAAAESGEQLMKLSDGVSNGDAMVREARQDVRVIAERTDDALRTHARTLESQRLAVEDSVALLETRHATLTAKVRSGTDGARRST